LKGLAQRGTALSGIMQSGGMELFETPSSTAFWRLNGRMCGGIWNCDWTAVSGRAF
jgi:hypothetical protein